MARTTEPPGAGPPRADIVKTAMRDAMPAMTERAFQAQVVQAAQVLGWRVFHPWSSLHSAAGWPDIIAVRGDRMLALELKSARGRVSPAQEEWLTALLAVPGVAGGVLRPDDWPRIEDLLR